MNCFLTKQTHHWKDTRLVSTCAPACTGSLTWTHLTGPVCLWVEDALAQPQARLLADLLQVGPHGLCNVTFHDLAGR